MNKTRLRAAVCILLILGIFGGAVLWSQGLMGGPRPKEVEPEPEQELSGWRADYSPSDLDLLARVVRAEAQGEPYDGQVAVAAVVLNRVRHPEFPNTIPGVIYEPRAFTVVTNGQVNKPADESALQAAHAALNGLDPTGGGALYFYNPAKTRDRWVRSRNVLKTIGEHIFAG